MLIKAKFDAGNITSGLAGMNSKLKESTLAGKSATTEFMRMKGTLIGLAAAAGLSAGVLLGMLTNAVMQSPFLAAALEKLKNQFMLFGNAIAKHVAPILEKLVSLIKWLREKFEALPDPIQGGIVKLIIFSGIILGMLGIIGTFILFLGAVKTAFIALVGTGVLAKLGAILGSIWALVAASLALQIAIGIVVGILGVMALDRSGALQWVSDMGEGFRNWDSIIRDVIVSLLGIPAILGGLAIDISRGDFEFGTTKAWAKEWTESMGRVGGAAIYGRSQYGEGTSTTSSALGWSAYNAPKGQQVENQSNTYNIDLSALQGNFEDPEAQHRLTEMISVAMAEQQQSLNV
jgi:hypothetical protein